MKVLFSLCIVFASLGVVGRAQDESLAGQPKMDLPAAPVTPAVSTSPDPAFSGFFKDLISPRALLATAPGTLPAPTRTVDPGLLMKLVSRNAKKGAQFTPQGILRWPLTSAQAATVLAETRALLDALTTGPRD